MEASRVFFDLFSGNIFLNFFCAVKSARKGPAAVRNCRCDNSGCMFEITGDWRLPLTADTPLRARHGLNFTTEQSNQAYERKRSEFECIPPLVDQHRPRRGRSAAAGGAGRNQKKTGGPDLQGSPVAAVEVVAAMLDLRFGGGPGCDGLQQKHDRLEPGIGGG